MSYWFVEPGTDPLETLVRAQSGDEVEIGNGDYLGGLLGVMLQQKGLAIRGQILSGKHPRPVLFPAPIGTVPLSSFGKNYRPPPPGVKIAAWHGMGGKGLCVVKGSDTTIEGIEFRDAHSLSLNGAGIRCEGINLTVRDCVFRHCEDGMLVTPADGPGTPEVELGGIRIEDCEFDNCGHGQYGRNHNLYVSHADELVVLGSNFHGAEWGHEIKSRAKRNLIAFNRIDGESWTDSYSIDLAGGECIIFRNDIRKGPNALGQTVMIHFQPDPVRTTTTVHKLFVLENFMVAMLKATGHFVYCKNDILDPATGLPGAITGGLIDKNIAGYRKFFQPNGHFDARNWGRASFFVPEEIRVGESNVVIEWAPEDEDLSTGELVEGFFDKILGAQQ